MAYTYNDVQNHATAYTLEGASSEAPIHGMDLEGWTALQQAYMASAAPPKADSGASLGAEQGIAFIRAVGEASTRLSTAQSVANVHLMNDNFIRDNITGK